VTDERRPIRHLGDLTPDPANARRHTPRNVGTIVDALHEVGAARSIVIDEDGTILAGNATAEAAAEAGIERVQVVDADGATLIAVRRTGLTPAQKQRLALFDNRAAELAEWDAERLSAFLAEDAAALEGLFHREEVEALLATLRPPPGADPGPAIDRAEELRAKWATAPGQLWTIGRHRLLCGDATSADDVARLMGGERAGTVLTDPPYGIALDTDWSDVRGSLRSIGATHGTRGRAYDPVAGDDVPFDPAPLFRAFGDCREMFLWGADYYAERIPDRASGSWLVWDKRKESQAEAIGSEFEVCWSKARHKRRLLRHDWFGFLSSENGAEARHRMHPTQKPTSLFRDILEQWAPAGAVVADPYLGSGTTAVAAEQTGRSCYALEIDPAYVAVALERLAGMGLAPRLAD